MSMINKLGPGDFATYTLERDGTTFETNVEILKIVNITYLSLVLLGFGFLVVGYVVVLTRPQGLLQRMFARYSIFLLLSCTLFPPQVSTHTDPAWKVILILSSALIARVIGPPTFVRFFLPFPVRHKALESRWLTPALYISSFILVVPLSMPTYFP